MDSIAYMPPDCNAVLGIFTEFFHQPGIEDARHFPTMHEEAPPTYPGQNAFVTLPYDTW